MMVQKTLLGLVLLTSPLMAAEGFREVTLKECFVLPPVNEKLVYNSVKGDQSPLSGRREGYQYDYALKEKKTIQLIKENKKGALVAKQFEQINNKVKNFRGDAVEYVKNLVEKFVQSRQFHRCDK